MKKLFFTLFLILLFSPLFSQEYDFLDPGIKRMTKPTGVQINPSTIKAFLYTGEKVQPSEINSYLMKIDYTAVLFTNQENEPAAIVFEQASEKAKAAKIKMYENYPGSDFMLNKQAPNFTLADLEGEKFNLESLKGEYVMLNFWFVGCKPCIMEMPELNEIVEEYESKGIHFVAIGLDNEARTKNFLTQKDFDYKLLPNGRRVAAQFGVGSYPTHLLLDREGKVIFSQQGYFPGLKYAIKARLDQAVKN